ncbi:MAG: LamB/YcsF family protein, partial [Rhodococcus sp. (in: high G+C Gram-positive bacteria)]|nr:LamB/YcsF family protein [Rhodococcus sp. (in: high G+C Gram-positive bacteria)]
PSLMVLAQDGALADEATARGLCVGIVGIADRAYNSDGTLVARSEPGAVIHDVDVLVERTVRMVVEEVVEAVDGTLIPVVADTVLVHGDNPGAVANAKAIRAALEAAGVTIAPLAQVVASRRARDVGCSA